MTEASLQDGLPTWRYYYNATFDNIHYAGFPPLGAFHGAEETGDQFLAFPAGFVLLQQEVAEVLFEAVNHIERRKGVQVGLQFELLLRLEIAMMAAHQGDQTAVLAGSRVDVAPTSQEVVVDEPD